MAVAVSDRKVTTSFGVPLCANVREKVAPSESTVRTEQGESGMTHGERDVLAGHEAGD
jgi:hypothetical protein